MVFSQSYMVVYHVQIVPKFLTILFVIPTTILQPQLWNFHLLSRHSFPNFKPQLRNKTQMQFDLTNSSPFQESRIDKMIVSLVAQQNNKIYKLRYINSPFLLESTNHAFKFLVLIIIIKIYNLKIYIFKTSYERRDVLKKKH